MMARYAENEEFIFIENEDGSDEKYEILYEFEAEDTDYILLILADLPDDEDEAEVFAFRYVKEGEDLRLEVIESEEEWEIVEEVFNTLANQ
jgi:uncharacterized protein YrzB (UPF0473 family)